jgi:hypothetical protein
MVASLFAMFAEAWSSTLDHVTEDVQELVGMMPCVLALSWKGRLQVGATIDLRIPSR